MGSRVPITISRGYTIEVMRRKLLTPRPGSAEPRHEFVRIFQTRANVTTRGGVAEIAQVDIDGKRATHTFAIRFTTLLFGVQDIVRDARGQLFQILRVEDKNLANRELLIHCANLGDETVEAAR